MKNITKTEKDNGKATKLKSITLDQCVGHLITKYLPYEFDMWTNYTVDTRLYNEIKKHCVVVAERNHRKTGRRNN